MGADWRALPRLKGRRLAETGGLLAFRTSRFWLAFMRLVVHYDRMSQIQLALTVLACVAAS